VSETVRQSHMEPGSGILPVIGETFFFRDKGLFSLLKSLILPELIAKRKKQRTLRLWSAGCSTGEEPYSIAIILDELLPRRKDNEALWDILILGTDVNKEAVEKAKKGTYGQWSFRMVSPHLQTRYFTTEKDKWTINESIRNMVEFRTGDLLEDSFPNSASEIHDMDIILCRNVFIYFNREAISIVLEKFIGTLNEGGYLITGHGELYAQNPAQLKPMIFAESVVYRKRAGSEGRSPESDEELNKSGVFQESAVKQKPLANVGRPSIVDKRTQTKIYKYEIETARAYADSGAYDKAALICRKAIEAEAAGSASSVLPYFLLAQIVEAQGDSNKALEEAKDLLKKVIYLDPAFVAAWIELGSIYDVEHDGVRAKKMYSTAMELLRALPPDALIEPYEGITAGQLYGTLTKRFD
jgi:chemotaxis protein methyltransferase CheR